MEGLITSHVKFTKKHESSAKPFHRAETISAEVEKRPQVNILDIISGNVKKDKKRLVAAAETTESKKRSRSEAEVANEIPEAEAEAEAEAADEAGRKDQEAKEGGVVDGDSQFRSQDEANSFRNRLQIRVKGNDIPFPCATFPAMAINAKIKDVILNNIENSDWKEPTPIQMQAIPSILAGRDVLAAAPTGSGKTGAFVIPMLSMLSEDGSSAKKHKKRRKKDAQSGSDGHGEAQGDADQSSSGIRGIILAPTKELAEQIHRETLRLCQGRRLKITLLNKSVASAVSKFHDKSLINSTDLLISTPLRLLTVLREGEIDLSHVRLVVLDEADKLFEFDSHSKVDADQGNAEPDRKERGQKRRRKSRGKPTAVEAEADEEEETEADAEIDAEEEEGDAEEEAEKHDVDGRSAFLHQIDEILNYCSNESCLQRALFSATVGPLVQELANSFLRDPLRITIGQQNTGASSIDQQLVFVGHEEGKLLAIRQLIQRGIRPPVLIFVESIDRAKELFLELVYDGINVDFIHSERTPQQREEIIRRFRIGDIWMLICTDLLARGVDFKGVSMVINYDLPTSAVSYIHRIGRTGRAGNNGTAVTFFTTKDMGRMRSIVNVVKLSGCAVPEWMLNIKQLTTKQKRSFRREKVERRSISTVPLFDKKNATKERKLKQKKRREEEKNKAKEEKKRLRKQRLAKSDDKDEI